MKKEIFILVFIVLLIGFSSAMKISPTQQALSIRQYETNCTYIWVLPENDYKLSSRWSMNGRGNFEEYVLDKREIMLEIDYSYLSEGKYEVCFNPGSGGNFSGVILFYSEEKMIEIASWIELKVERVDRLERASYLVGRTIKNIEAESSELKEEILAGILIFLVGFLFMIMFTKKLN